MENYQPLKLTLEDGRRALAVHCLDQGHKLRQKYGKAIGYDLLKTILKDETFVRHPVRLVFDSTKVEEGMFALAERVSLDASAGFIIYLHECFKQRPGDLLALVFYHLVAVNYGEFATHNEAEEFGSSALGMEKEEYYQLLCCLTDRIPST
jgi:hypothetical protein